MLIGDKAHPFGFHCGGLAARLPGSSWLHSSLMSMACWFAVLILSSRLSIPVPGAAAPLTLQTLAVSAAGFCLGPLRGFSVVLAWFTLGLLGAPVLSAPLVFSDPLAWGRLGYLLAMPIAAASVGYLAKRRLPVAASLMAGNLLVVTTGSGLLGLIYGFPSAWSAGWLPFLGAEALKALVGASLLRLSRPKHKV
jgi:biotin transporter BioY